MMLILMAIRKSAVNSPDYVDRGGGRQCWWTAVGKTATSVLTTLVKILSMAMAASAMTGYGNDNILQRDADADADGVGWERMWQHTGIGVVSD